MQPGTKEFANLTRSYKISYKNVLQDLAKNLTRSYKNLTKNHTKNLTKNLAKILQDLTRFAISLVPGFLKLGDHLMDSLLDSRLTDVSSLITITSFSLN